MSVPCVAVPPEKGERTRQALADLELLDDAHEITVEDDRLYIPVSEPTAVPGGYDVVAHDAPERDRQTLPADVLGWEPSYERLGDVVILDEDDPDRAREAARAIAESAIPARTVVNRASPVEGELRVRRWDVLHGDGTETIHREYGCEFALDIAEVYFSPRLATERHRVVERVESGEHFFDMFAGVGPFVIPAAKRGAEAVGVDLNERAIEYLRENAERNGVCERVTAIAGDVRDAVSGSSRPGATDGVREAEGYEDWADRLVMNLPHSADEFLDTAVALAGEECTLHYYDIQHEDDPFGPGEREIRAAAEPDYGVEIEECREVRSYAPHELNVCLDVRLRRA